MIHINDSVNLNSEERESFERLREIFPNKIKTKEDYISFVEGINSVILNSYNKQEKNKTPDYQSFDYRYKEDAEMAKKLKEAVTI